MSFKNDLLFADKPAGCTTHTSLNEKDRLIATVDLNDGFKELLESRLGSELFTVHRLDRETSGALIFARTAKLAEKLRQAFAGRNVHKRYLLLTDRTVLNHEFEASSFIERVGNEYHSSRESKPNSKTRFRLLEASHGLFLWEAFPETGKSHQIRLHALDHGMPILGDSAHEGSAFPALCLHSCEIEFEVDGESFRHESKAPRWYFDRSLCHDQLLVKWLKAVDRRERLGSVLSGPTLRWIHSEGDPLRAEQIGDVYSLSWFEDLLPSAAREASIRRLTEILGWEKWYLQVRGNRGRTPNEEKRMDGPTAIPARWESSENSLKFEFRTDTGLSPGLFLDQRRNRQWVSENSRDARVLNLFCYTGGFSVAAAVGGAAKTVSVDVSKPFLDWTRQNFELNSLDLAPHEFRFIDSREYLAWAKKKGLEFDLVICDPPSFGRSKAGVFRIDKDFDDLISLVTAVVSSKGRVLFSSNFESWDDEEFSARLKAALKALGTRRKWKIMPTPSADWDFEMPNASKSVTRNMKSCFLV